MKFPIPCRDNFDKMASENPYHLLEWLMDGSLSNAHLSFALESLGRETARRHQKTRTIVLDVLIVHLKTHKSPLVREGALLGICYHLDRKIAASCVEHVAQADESNIIREIAKDTLEYYREE